VKQLHVPVLFAGLEDDLLAPLGDADGAPEQFIFRVVPTKPIGADRLRITVEQAVPGQAFSINELRLYEQSSR
jgi:hypothetical protein